ncbi:MAG: trypsin-like peptidase domain-containing protein, partial [Clostridiales bacterium]|nr:trypsin-like peptidase domain-containing protein [Clostridiales bacterium]
MSENNEDRKLMAAYRRNLVIVFVMAVLLAGSIIFSALQTVYIYRLNTGKTGLLDYTSGESTEEGEGGSVHSLSSSSEDLPEPWFSLEDAAGATNTGKQRLSVTDIVDKVSPATVSLYIRGKVNGATRNISSGSAFIISEDGYAVTNAHVVSSVATGDQGYELCASIHGNKELIQCEVVGIDTQTDCAVIKLKEGRKYDHVTLGNSSDLRVGELAVAIGNALGTLDGTVTVGVISSLDRTISHEQYRLPVIQTDAAINSGNSGGALINSFGEVIGITNAKMVVNQSEGLGFAIPIDTVKPVIESLINYGKVVNRAYLGVTVAQVDENSYYGSVPGVYVFEYVKDGPADKAGLRNGDRIVKMDGIAINETDDIIVIRDKHKVGDTIEFEIERDGKQMKIELVVGDGSEYEGNSTVSSQPDDPGSTAPSGRTDPTD